MPSAAMNVLDSGRLYDAILFLAETGIKGAMLCSIAGAAALMMRRSSAYSRKIVWVAALAGLLVLPAVSSLTPVWRLPVIPAVKGYSDGGTHEPFLSSLPGKDPLEVADADGGGGSGISTDDEGSAGGITWALAVLVIWLAGTIAAAAFHISARLHMLRLSRKASPVAPEVAETALNIMDRMGLKQRPELLESEMIPVAVNAGIIRPSVIISSRSRSWSDERLRLVLSHELAHVKRRDIALELLAGIVTVIHWFDPLVWLAAHRLRVERERDCDNLVLNCGGRPSDYASLLIEIAADIGLAARPKWEVVTISQRSNLKDRLLCILNPSVNRSAGSRKSVAATWIATAAIAVTLSISSVRAGGAGGDGGPGKEKARVQAYLQQERDEKKREQEKKQQHEEQMRKTYRKDDLPAPPPPPEKEELRVKGEKGLAPPPPPRSELSTAQRVEQAWQSIISKSGDRSAAVRLAYAMKGTGPGGARINLDKLRQAAAEGEDVYFDESEFNTLGYVLLKEGKTEEAIEVFRLNADMYPDSWNVYDSLAEGMMSAGKYDEAEKLYGKSVGMNPDNDNGRMMIQKIRQMKVEGR